MAWSDLTVANSTAGNAILASDHAKVFENLNILGQAWTSFTPALRQATTAVTTTTNYSKYIAAGKLIIWSFQVTTTGSGPSTGNVDLTIPVTAATSALVIGVASVYDTSATTTYSGHCYTTSTTRIIFTGDWSGGNNWGATPAIQIGIGDVFRGMCVYEAA